jgi:hypothetical protein
LWIPPVIAINVDLGKDFTTGVVDTSGKLTGGKFVAGLIDTGVATLNCKYLCEYSRIKSKWR